MGYVVTLSYVFLPRAPLASWWGWLVADFLSPPYPTFKRFSNKTVTAVAIYPKQLFIARCPTFLFSKRVRSLVELWSSGYILSAVNASQYKQTLC